MKGLRLLLAVALAVATLPLQGADPPEFAEKRITAQQLGEIRRGGFVLYLRHGYTDNSRADRMPNVDLDDCSTQRVLSDAGRALMREVGQNIRAARIPLGEVLASPYCRTQESARLAVGEGFRVELPLAYSANMTAEEKRPRIAALRQLLGRPVAPGGNRLIVAHAPNLADLIGFFVKPEGNMVVFRPGGEKGFEYIGSVHPEDWAKLAR
jgi:phosphohistidine phosphatase SixA